MAHERENYFKLDRPLQATTHLGSLEDIKAIQVAQTKALASEAADFVLRWLQPYPTFLLNRIRSTSLACAAMCPDCGLTPVVTALKIGSILFAIDDFVDGTRLVPDDEEADGLLVACRDVALHKGEIDIQSRLQALRVPLAQELIRPWLEVMSSLTRFCGELLDMPGSDTYYPFFADMFGAAMDGMRAEVRARRAYVTYGVVPDYEEYLESAKQSIASPALCASVLVAMAPSATAAAVQECSKAFREFSLTAGACVRLANDVRSYARETELEQRPNSVLILTRTRGLSEREAQEVVIAEAGACLAALAPLVSRLPAPLHHWADAVSRFTSTIRDWYLVRELHE